MKKRVLILLITTISLFGCRVSKKEWDKTVYAEKQDVEALKKSFNQKIEEHVFTLQETINNKYNEVVQQKTESLSASKSESTIVSGTIKSEEGKEKTATIGGTTIVSNGADINFKTTYTQDVLEKYKETKEEILSELQIEINKREFLEKKVDSLYNIIEHLQSTKDIDSKNTKSEVKKTGFQLGVWIIIAIAVIVVIVLWYFKNQIPFLKNI